MITFVSICICWLGVNISKSKISWADDVDATGYWTAHTETVVIQEGQATISTPGQFAYVCQKLNEKDNDFNGVIYNITEDLDFSKYYWVPVGYVDSKVQASFVAKPSNPTKDTVKFTGLKIDNSGTNFPTYNNKMNSFGLFGVVDECTQYGQGYILGIVLENISIKIDVDRIESDVINIGALAGYFAGQKENNNAGTSSASVRNCSVTGQISIYQSNSATKKLYIGGLVGQIGKITGSEKGSEIGYTKSATNEVKIDLSNVQNTQSTYTVGGIVGYNSGTLNNEVTTSGIKIQNFCNITSDFGYCGLLVGENAVGGIIKNATGGKSDKSTSFVMSGDTNNPMCVGGLVGVNRGIIQNSKNYTMLIGYKGTLGGIAGENYGTIFNCENLAEICLDGSNIPNSVLLSDGSNFKESPILGGIVGNNKNGSIISCVNNIEANVGGLNNLEKLGGVIGGIAGYNGANCEIANCVNYGVIAKDMYSAASGGIVGSNSGTITADITKTSGSKFTANLGTVYANLVAGGISGVWNLGGSSGTPKISVSNSYNVGQVRGRNTSSTLGGIVGSVANCTTDSIITNCINLGDIGSIDNSGISGGVVGQFGSVTVTIRNCANYATLSAVGTLGGIVGRVGEGGSPQIEYALSTGKLVPASRDTVLGGIIGKFEAMQDLDLTKCVFDLGVSGYGLPTGWNENSAMLYKVKVVGTGSSKGFSMENSPITYYMTKPGISSVGASEYYIKGFENDDWYFHDANLGADTYFYAVPSVFSSNGIFIEDTSKINDSSLVRGYPVQKLSCVSIENKLPIEWNEATESEVYQVSYINIYAGLLPSSAKNEVLSGNGQYIITGQKLAQPKRSDNALYKSQYGTVENFDKVVNDLAWAGTYNIHEGYMESFHILSGSTIGDVFDFDNNLVDKSNLKIVISWTPRQFNVLLYEYDMDSDNYLLCDDTKTITYSINPQSTQHFDLISKEGRTFYGWRLDDSLKYKNYKSEAEWVAAWDTDESVLDIPNNVFYTAGLKLYCMSTLQRIELRLHGGSVDDVLGVFDDGTTEKVISISFGTPVTLPVPTISLGNYAFRGYFDSIENGTCIVEPGKQFPNKGADTKIELWAYWTYTVKTVRYVTVVNGAEIELKSFEINYNQQIAYSNQMNEQNLAAWKIDYSKVDAKLDPKGYTFAGVYSDAGYQNEFDYASTILDDTVIFVKWNVKNFSLILNVNIGKDPNGNQRSGSWGNGDLSVILEVPYNTDLLSYLQNWKQNYPEISEIINVIGFSPEGMGYGYLWANIAVGMGGDYNVENVLNADATFRYMPAESMDLYIIWKRLNASITFNANGGHFDEGATKTFEGQALFEANLKNTISNLMQRFEKPVHDDDENVWVFKYWSLTADGEQISDTALLPMDCTVYAIYGIQKRVKFYVTGAYPENLIGEVLVFEGSVLGDEINGMNDIIERMKNLLTDDEGQSAFELDYWVEMTYDMAYNITEAKEPFDFDTRIINDNINLLAKLKPNANYVPPAKDTTNYILIAGIVIVVSLVLLFVVLVARPGRVELSADSKVKNEEIQKQLNEIKELDRRRRNMENPFDD